MKKLLNLITVSFYINLFSFSTLFAQGGYYASRFYAIEYSNDTVYSCPRIDSVEIFDIYGKVFYRGKKENVQLIDGYTKLKVKKGKVWNTYDIEGKKVNGNTVDIDEDPYPQDWLDNETNAKETSYSIVDGKVITVERNYAIVEQSDKKGVVDILSGKYIIPCQYDYIHLNKNYRKNEILYAACMKYTDDTTLDYIRLSDGKITNRYHNYRGEHGSVMVIDDGGIRYSWNYTVGSSYGGINIYGLISGYMCVLSYDGKIIIDESFKLESDDIYLVNDYIITDKGIFDITGKLLYEGDFKLKCYDTETFCILFNKQTQKREYFVFDENVFHKVDNFDDISRFYYTRCQEKYHNQQ